MAAASTASAVSTTPLRSARGVHWQEYDEVIVWQSPVQECGLSSSAGATSMANPPQPEIVASFTPRSTPGEAPYPRLLDGIFRPLKSEDQRHPLHTAFTARSSGGKVAAHGFPDGTLTPRNEVSGFGTPRVTVGRCHAPLAAALRPISGAFSFKGTEFPDRSWTDATSQAGGFDSCEMLIAAKEAQIAGREVAAAARERSLREAKDLFRDRVRDAVEKERGLNERAAIVAQALATGVTDHHEIGAVQAELASMQFKAADALLVQQLQVTS